MHLTLSWWRSLSYTNKTIDLQSKSMDIRISIMKSHTKSGTFPTKCKKQMSQSIKRWQTTNRELSSDLLLSICGKILERLICNKMFFTDNELISLGLKPGDSCINQLLCITCDIYQSVDYGLQTRDIFVNISKSFDKVWHEDLPYRLKQNSMSDNLLNLITDFFVSQKTKNCFYKVNTCHGLMVK